MQACDAIPLIIEKLPDPSNLCDFTERPYHGLSTTVILHHGDVLKVEADEKVNKQTLYLA